MPPGRGGHALDAPDGIGPMTSVPVTSVPMTSGTQPIRPRAAILSTPARQAARNQARYNSRFPFRETAP